MTRFPRFLKLFILFMTASLAGASLFAAARSGEDIVMLMDKGVEARDGDAVRAALSLAIERNDRKCLADCFLRAGNYYYFMSEKGQSEEMYRKALELYSALLDLSGQSIAQSRIGNLFLGASEFDKAMQAFETALKLARRAADLKAEALARKGIGDICNYKDDLTGSMGNYQELLELALKAKDTSLQGDAYKSIGELYYYSDELDKAQEMLQKAGSLYRSSRDELGEAGVLRREGDVSFFRGDNEASLESYGKALRIYEKYKDGLGVAAIYKSMADLHFYSGNLEEALKAYDKALPLFEKAGNLSGQGNIYQRQGEIYISFGDAQKALEALERSLALQEKAQSLIGQGNAYFREGDVYFMSGDYRRAVEIYDKAISFYERSGSVSNLCSVLIRKGNICFEIGENSKALQTYDKSLELCRSIDDPRGTGTSLKCIGDVYLAEEDYKRSEESYLEALRLFEKINSLQGQANVYYGLGEVDYRMERSPQSLQMIDKAVAAYRKLGDINDECAALFLKARIIEQEGKTGEAFSVFRETITLLEKARGLAAFSELKKTFMTDVYEYYEYSAVFMAENGYGREAFDISESLKGRVFLDSLAEQEVDLDQGVASELKDKREELTGRISELSQAISDSVEGGNEEGAEKFRKEYEDSERELEDLQIEIRLKNPMYASVRYPAPVSLPALQKDVLNQGETLVEYFVSSNNIFAFVVTRDTFRVVKIGQPARLVSLRTRAYLEFIRSGSYVPIKDTAACGRSLYEALVKPVEPYIRQKSTLIIVPDGELALLPFEALVTDLPAENGRIRYLLEEHPVKYFQSASVLAMLRSLRPKEVPLTFAGLGDPLYQNFERLEGSGEELEKIAQIFKEASLSAVLKLRENATEEFAKSQEAGNFGFLHFACHGILDRGSQSLVLSQVPGAKENGYFTLGEIMNCRYNARMVVLSACRTGMGKVEKGEGVTGLTRAVMYAGIPSAVVSLWSVSDASTSRLMSDLYRNIIKDGKSGSDAMRNAKLKMLRSRGSSHPFFWAPFVMYGEWDQR